MQVYGTWYTGPTSATDTIASTTGTCDTIVTINISVDPYLTSTINASFCAGDSVQVYGTWYSVANTYTDTISSVTAACDTIVTINVTEESLIPKSINANFCSGDSVQVYGTWFSVAGSFTDTVASTTGGCDTLLTINITEDPLLTNTVNASHCPGDSVQVYGTWYRNNFV